MNMNLSGISSRGKMWVHRHHGCKELGCEYFEKQYFILKKHSSRDVNPTSLTSTMTSMGCAGMPLVAVYIFMLLVYFLQHVVYICTIGGEKIELSAHIN